MKKTLWLITLLIFLLPLLSSVAQASLEIYPGKLTISMPEGYPTERISYKIQVTNPFPYAVNASTRIEHPSNQTISANYSHIPDLSWVTVEPEILFIPANTSGFFEVFLDIPENERQNSYHKSWETWVVIHSDQPAGEGGGIVININIAVKLFIHTPPAEKIPIAGIFILIGVIIAGGVTVILLRNARKNIPGK